MSETEYAVLDELYFLSSFDELLERTGLSEEVLRACLAGLWAKEWIRCYQGRKEEIPQEEVNLEESYARYCYFASKKGLFAHNSR